MKRKPRRTDVSLLDLVAADKAEYGSIPGRNPKCIPHWKPAEMAVVERFARGVLSKRYRNAVLAVESCRAAVARCRDGIGPELRTRQSVHRMLVTTAIRLGRVRSRVRWMPGEKTVLDRFAKAVADGRYQTARGAGRACLAAITELHERYPHRYAGVPPRSIHTIQHELWPRVAKLRDRWFNSHWSAEELGVVDRFARALLAHEFPYVRVAARECAEAINRMHSRRAGRALTVRTIQGVTGQILNVAARLGRFSLPHRHWTDAELRVAARWMHKFLLHRRGKLRMNVYTIAGLMQGELHRLGYYRTESACVAAVYEQWRGARGLRRARPPVRRGLRRT